MRVQRARAVWVARYCCTRSRLIANDWVEAAVTALERGDPPPPWFADFDSAFARWRGVPRESLTWAATVSFGEVESAPIDPAVVAIHVVIAAREEDPLVAVMDAVHNAVESDPDATIVAFRTAFDLA